MPSILPAIGPDGTLSQSAIAEAVNVLARGGLVALPTETVYGLAANALDTTAVRRIFEAKGRPTFNPLITHVLDAPMAGGLVEAWPEVAERLVGAFWPGPLSLILPKSSRIPAEVTAGLPAVALRAPAHPVIRAVIELSGLPLAAPSANRSNAISPTAAAHVAASLGDRVDLILDGGTCEWGIESTVVDLTRPLPVVLRPGGITAQAVERVVGRLGTAAAPEGTAARVSPGQLARHYAPDAVTTIFTAGSVTHVLAEILAAARIGGLALGTARPPDARIVHWEQFDEEPRAYARNLYAGLHRAEREGCTHILIEDVPRTSEWDAVRDRLTRASTRE